MVKRTNFRYLNKKECHEIFLYQLLGVNFFKKMTLNLERIIHYHENKDVLDEKQKKRNINYHPKDTSLQGLKDFKKFLYYNGFIHVKNSLIYSVVIMAIAFIPFINYLNAILIPLLIMNLYCVMLQRYTYLRTEDSIRMMERKNEISVNCKVNKLEHINQVKEHINKDLIDVELIDKIIAFINNEADVCLTEADLESLQTINHYLDLLNDKNVLNNDVSKVVLEEKPEVLKLKQTI